ncbi:hypothetical protein D9M70_595950 [compost metagenome]
MAPLRMIRSSPAMAMTEALDAAIASTTTVTLPLWATSELKIATPSSTYPPPELIRTTMSVSRPISASASITSREVKPSPQ